MDFNYLMGEAIAEALKARQRGEIPVGALIIDGSHEIIAREHNKCITENDPTAHAEILAIKCAAKALNNYRLNGTAMVVTIEPCPMCMGAIINARLDMLVFGAFDPKGGAAGSQYNLAGDGRLNHRLEVISGIMAKECGQILQDFFREKR